MNVKRPFFALKDSVGFVKLLLVPESNIPTSSRKVGGKKHKGYLKGSGTYFLFIFSVRKCFLWAQ